MEGMKLRMSQQTLKEGAQQLCNIKEGHAVKYSKYFLEVQGESINLIHFYLNRTHNFMQE